MLRRHWQRLLQHMRLHSVMLWRLCMLRLCVPRKRLLQLLRMSLSRSLAGIVRSCPGGQLQHQALLLPGQRGRQAHQRLLLRRTGLQNPRGHQQCPTQQDQAHAIPTEAC